MEIKTYKKTKGNQYEVTFTNGEKIKLYDDIILKYELLIDKNLDKKKYDKILKENANCDAYYRALKYISIRMRSELEIRKYLARYELTNSEIDYAVNNLRRDGYLNDELYAHAFIQDQITLTLNGPKKISDLLKKLGVSGDFVNSELDNIDSSEWKSRIEKIVSKKAKLNKAGESVFKNKVYQDLVILGYYSEDIRSILNEFHLDTDNVFLKEADKMYNKLSNKYDGAELELRFKSKMFAKGFKSDEISNYLNKKI
jgi:regulatory protein